MTTVRLLPHTEKLASDNPWGLEYPPLYHQLRTHEALRDHDLVVNTYNTGAGKTIAGLLHLFDLRGTGKNVLFIAPTNALLQQHVEDIRKFVAENELDFQVLRVTAGSWRASLPAQPATAIGPCWAPPPSWPTPSCRGISC